MTVAHLPCASAEADALEVNADFRSALWTGYGFRRGQKGAGHHLADDQARRRVSRLIGDQSCPRAKPQPTTTVAQDGFDFVFEGRRPQADALEGLTVVAEDAAAASTHPDMALRISRQRQDAIGRQPELLGGKPAHLPRRKIKGEQVPWPYPPTGCFGTPTRRRHRR